MAPSISLILEGTEHPLSEIGALIGHDGWGMAPLHRLESRGAEQHGSTDEGFRLDPRLGDLIFQAPGRTLDDLYDMRDTAISLLSPLGELILKWAYADGRVRYIACHYHSSLSLPWDSGTWAAPKLAVTLQANDPTFYDPAAKAVTFTLADIGGGAGGVVPTPVPTAVGASTIDGVQAIAYAGNWRAWPDLIRITGPITNFVLSNEITGAVIQAKTGITIAAGDYYDIDTRFDAASVVNAAGVNKIADLVDADDLTIFYLAPAPEVADGINVLRLTGSGVTSATRVDISYFDRYLGT